MPIESWIDESRGRVVARVQGDFTFEEIVAAIDRAVCDPRFRPGFHVLSDHTGVGEPLSPAQARLMVAHLEQLAGLLSGSRWAVVTTKPASYGMLRVVGALAEPLPLDVEVFQSFEDAERWLSGTEEG